MRGQTQARPRLATLDAARGIAALIVACYHLGTIGHVEFESFGGYHFFAKGYLAVDLFFLLSGFVIALCYEGKLAAGGMGVAQFLRLRAIRLYPLYLAGTLAGLAVWLWTHPAVSAPPCLLAAALAGLPNLACDRAFDTLYPFNEAGWSLGFEAFVNIVWCLALVRLRSRWLWLVFAASACLLLRDGLAHGSFDFGFEPLQAAAGAARTVASFVLGLLLFRHLPQLPRIAVPPLALLAALAAALAAPLGLAGFGYDVVFVFGLAPLFVAAGCRVEPPAALRGLFGQLGRLSYAIYVLHLPCIRIAALVWNHVSGSPIGQSPVAGAAATLALVATASWAATALLDEPLRAALARLAGPSGMRIAPVQAMAAEIPARPLQTP